ncbi:major histocompatibility complex class I-related protein 1-like [Halichoeres trimaculatus]|uniref:major histocompatibility complex class I-related protein 1-like n=1 Tax=Halichoeres trimaculatus TaxID=147232 RepID=UPI003D9E6A62
MKILFVLPLLFHAGSTVRYTLKFLIAGTSGLHDFPEFMGVVMINEVQFGYCDSNTKTAKPSQDWSRQFVKDHPDQLLLYTQECLSWPRSFRGHIHHLKEVLNQSEGVHILQHLFGCEWDDESEETDGFDRYGYDGEDLLTLDMKTMTWTVPKLHMTPSALGWKTDETVVKWKKKSSISMCLVFLEKYVQYAGSFLQRTDLPTVSLLQKSPSSPVSCFATGFFPDRAVMFWRKDGEELFKNQRDLLPNHDGSFQMSVDLNISLVKTEDWRRYECVFQLSGVKEDIVTKLEKTAIRSNHVSGSGFPTGRVTGVIVGLLLLSVCIAGLFIWRKNNNGFQLVHRDQGALEVDAELQ